MYRDDTCAVCGESLPPDHLYCREHAAEVDDRLREIGELLECLTGDLPRLVELLGSVAPETWDWLADESAGEDERVWPPTPSITFSVHADDVDVDVDTEPGRVRIDLATDLQTVLASLQAGLATTALDELTEACRSADGAGATH